MKEFFRSTFSKVMILSLLLLTSGCALERVKPWERDLLAQDKMQLEPHPIDAYLDEHIYYSKEASSGGSGIGGGGCGCN